MSGTGGADTGGGPAAPAAARRNGDADWDRWPVHDYLRENYRELHPATPPSSATTPPSTAPCPRTASTPRSSAAPGPTSIR
ncbi:hypothetical protein ACFQ60_44200 [Streptomyces zhihengii]